MSVKKITTEEMRRMNGAEGLVFEGCKGPEEWLDGLNDLLTKDGILLNGTKFDDVLCFEQNGMQCLLFPITENVKVDMDGLGEWMRRTQSEFFGEWLSDYVENSLDGYLPAGVTDEGETQETEGLQLCL